MADSLPCPFCHQEISLSFYAKHLAAEGGRLGGKSRSAAKRSASRENGKKLSRPKVQASEHQLLQLSENGMSTVRWPSNWVCRRALSCTV